jgi:predicted RNA-binding Zn-ribbon protein involved in translation (DUF1610 family)
MIGRYGPDHLGVAMILLSIALTITHTFVQWVVILYISYLIAGLALFRMLSRNIARRRAENDMFIRYYWPIKTKISRMFGNMSSKNTHKVFNCPSCNNTLRVPKGKGKIQVTCPKCGERFFRKT